VQNVFWTGRLSPYCMAVVNANCALAWLAGSARDRAAMKRRVQAGYDGASSDYVERYDELGWDHYHRAGRLLLDSVDVSGSRVLDVGCGTGIVSFLALERGAAEVVGGDCSSRNLRQCEDGARARGFGVGRAEFNRLDAESLPFADKSFDLVVSGMVLGFLPDQPKAVAEMARVVRSGGWVALTTQGPAHYWEPSDAAIRAARKRYLLGYRFEMWFRSPDEVKRIMLRAGLRDVTARSVIWQHKFLSGGEAYDFYAATTSSWWLDKYPSELRREESDRVRAYFQRRGVTSITSDIVVATGRRE
jgi:ubiquinone/menaquinone biosynthesis C-methylase UbiE